MFVYSCIHIFGELLLKIPLLNSNHRVIGSSEAEMNVVLFSLIIVVMLTGPAYKDMQVGSGFH